MYTHEGKVNRFNQTILELLREKKKSVGSLAAHLNYDVAAVGRQLHSEQTFPFGDLVKICSFLGQLPADFFYERQPAELPEIYCQLKGDQRLVLIRMRETGKQLARYFERKVVYN